MRHVLSGCPCGHTEHVGEGLQSLASVRCDACLAEERRDSVVLASETVARVEALGVGNGSLVRCAGRTCRIVSIAEVTRLGGSYHTGFATLKLREVVEA
jgi:hypothetical protein